MNQLCLIVFCAHWCVSMDGICVMVAGVLPTLMASGCQSGQISRSDLESTKTTQLHPMLGVYYLGSAHTVCKQRCFMPPTPSLPLIVIKPANLEPLIVVFSAWMHSPLIGLFSPGPDDMVIMSGCSGSFFFKTRNTATNPKITNSEKQCWAHHTISTNRVLLCGLVKIEWNWVHGKAHRVWIKYGSGGWSQGVCESYK